jgi:uncharacterized membrane protein
VLLLALALPLLAGCLQADTLGDEPPDEIVISGTPTWNNGMASLLQLKCGVCHAVPRPDHAPDDTPDDFDLNTLTSPDGEVDGAQETLGDLQAAVSSGAMPPAFATPLTDRERGYILVWDGS